jgi:hypothetical protein
MSDFTFKKYSELLINFRKKGYINVDFSKIDPSKKHIVVRHDIDMTMDSAVKMAEIEHEIGIKATYFILLRSGMYNVFSKEVDEKIRRILELNHTIGLHFDPSLYLYKSVRSLDKYCFDECLLLERWFNINIDIVSFHRPASIFLGLDDCIGGRSHTYQPCYFKDIAYCSDSRGDWHYGHPLDIIKLGNFPALQLLVHPVWWDSQSNESSEKRLDRLVVEHNHDYQIELGSNCQVFKSQKHSK